MLGYTRSIVRILTLLLYGFLIVVLAENFYNFFSPTILPILIQLILFGGLLVLVYNDLNSQWKPVWSDVVKTKIANAPDELREVLAGKKFDVFWALLRALDKVPDPINQSEWFDLVDSSLDRSGETLRGYVKKLLDMQLVRDASEDNALRVKNESGYILTERGKWVVQAINQYFPTRKFWVIIRRDLRLRRRIPKYPYSDSNEGTTHPTISNS